MFDFLNTTYYGNTGLQWLVSLTLCALTVIGGRMVSLFLGRFVRYLTRKRELRWIDAFVDALKEPVVAAFVVTGIRYALAVLTLSDEIAAGVENVFNFAVTMMVVWLLLRLYDLLHHEYLVKLAERTESPLDDQLIMAMRTGIRFVVVGLGVVIGLNNAGYDVGTILAGLGIGGLALALAAQHTVGNLIGWVNILVDHHFRPGERIQLRANGEDIDGVVLNIGLRATRILTWEKRRVMSVPNSIVANSAVVNVDSEEARRMRTVFKLSPHTSYEKLELVLRLLKEIVKANENTTGNTVTALVQVSEISRDVLLIYHVKSGTETPLLQTRTAINLEIARQFEAHDIEFTTKSTFSYQKSAAY